MRRIMLPVAGTTTATGTLTLTLPLEKTGEWRIVKVALGTTGPAEWALSSANSAVNYGRGRRVTMGPELLEPYDVMTVTITGGPPSAAVSGSVVGLSGQLEEIVPLYQPQPNMIALDTSSQEVVIGTITAGAGATVGPTTFIVPVGSLAIGFVTLNNPVALDTPVSVRITGVVSGVDYFLAASATQTQGVQFAPLDPLDTSVQVTLAGAAIGGSAIDVIASSVIPVVTIRQNAGDLPLSVFLSRNDGALIDTDIGTGTNPSVGVTMLHASPAPWQAQPFSFQSDANQVIGTRFQLVAGTAGLSIYLGAVSFSSNGAAKMDLEDGSGGTIIGRMHFTAAAAPPHVHPFGGRKLTAGNGLFGNLTAGGVECIVTGSYDKG